MSCDVAYILEVQSLVISRLPDVRSIARDMVLCSRIKISFRSRNGWGYTLIFTPGMYAHVTL